MLTRSNAVRNDVERPSARAQGQGQAQRDAWWATSLRPHWSPGALAALAPAAAGVPAALWEKALLGPVSDILSRPGKQFRARLVSLGWRLGGGRGEPPPELVACLEILHAGSMIVDDIEDGSQERRRAPAVHVLHGVPLALNAGNWMYFVPFALLAGLDAPAPRVQALTARVARTLLDCHYGQALDLGAKIDELPPDRIRAVVETISTLKTGRLTELAAAIGAEAAGASPERVDALGAFGLALGEALQKLDDIANLAPVAEGKRFEDLRLGRLTWPWAWAGEHLGAEELGQLLAEGRAVYAAARTGSPAERREEALAQELRATVEVTGRAQAHRDLQAALGKLEAALGASAELGELAGAIAHLEASYG